MTAQQQHLPATFSTDIDYELLAASFRPTFARIAEGAVQREQTRSLPFEASDWLKHDGFGAVRVPKEFGGSAVSLPQLTQLLIELATADSKVNPWTATGEMPVPPQPQSTDLQRTYRW